MDLAADYFARHQSADGYWRDFQTLAGESTEWVTGYCAAILAHLRLAPEPLERATRALVGSARRNGGWGYHAGVPTDADSTAYVLHFLGTRLPHHAVVTSGLDSLVRAQAPATGGVPTYCSAAPIRQFMGLPDHFEIQGWCSPHVEVTAAAGLAFAQSSNHAAHASRAWSFLASRQRGDGLWHSYWWNTPLYPTSLACRLGLALGAIPAVRRAAASVAAWQAREGGFGLRAGDPPCPFATALAVQVLRSAGAHDGALARGCRWLADHQQPDGAWDSEPVLCIPHPERLEPGPGDPWRVDALGTGVVLRDQHRLYTTATCVAALGTEPVA
ncbi:hypothetical protein OV208_40215 [Corallococcus sp. bb12-1]|uniref:hypothetical protein n=1 Tax=Corallococcus sp. bb12-1 TaxID=2996784 RepID=UPI002271A5DA|nr:hypothetical protein [Corallococcus sp. bb12-1]MCY1047593.1 hypothetical protein [Corallococcus sp. bb12-1]